MAKFGVIYSLPSHKMIDGFSCQLCDSSTAKCDRVEQSSSSNNQYSGSTSIQECSQDNNDSKKNPSSLLASSAIEFAFETNQCHHWFHLKCAKKIISNNIRGQYVACPVCKTWIKAGTQPTDGEMKIRKENYYLPGQPTCIVFGNPIPVIKIMCKFKDVTDKIACAEWEEFLPLTQDGIKIAKMLKVAFDQKLLFSVVHSEPKKIVHNLQNVLWSASSEDEIKRMHKIECVAIGYPNYPQYLQRYEMHLRVFGITDEDL